MSNEELIEIFRKYCFISAEILHEICIRSNSISESNRERFAGCHTQLVKYFGDIDFLQFNISELKKLGFAIWDDDIILAPTWVINICKDGTEFISISGDKKIKGIDEISDDTRFGVTAYGFSISQLRDKKLEQLSNE